MRRGLRTGGSVGDGVGSAFDVGSEAEAFERIRASYIACFDAPAGKEVLGHLYLFCRQGRTTFDENPYRLAFNEGKRAVMLEILRYLNMDTEALYHQTRGTS